VNTPLPPTLGRRVLRHILLPLGVTWVAGTIVAIAIAQLFAQRAFDRSMLDDAFLLSTHVRIERGALQLNLTQREINAILYDQDETVYFSVRGADGALVIGHPGLRMAAADREGQNYRFDYVPFSGHVLRAVTLHATQPAPFDVTVAETTTARDALLRQLVLYSVLPQMALLALLAVWLARAIRSDTRSLASLEQAVANRGVDDLAPVAVDASTRDVQALGNAINALLQRLERSVRAQREFTGNVAHELRTPLAGIRALAEYGLAQKDPAAWREQLQAIAASQARASALVERLLALALAEEAESRLKLQPLALDQVVRDAVLRFLRRADQAGVDLGARGIEAPVWVAADRTLLEGILNNLIDNALRYGVDPGQAEPAVTVAIEATPDEVTFLVQDNGPGAPGEQQAHLMQRGAQGEAGQLLGQGAGLGLALVAQYARLLKGRMHLHSGPGGRGWVCEITLPRLPRPPELQPPLASGSSAAAAPAGESGSSRAAVATARAKTAT
jgi:two-component system, OmpR family, sensor histidine kinase TctE